MISRILVFLCLAVTSNALADAVEEVRDHEIRFSQAVEIQDIELFTSLIDEDARFVSGVVSRGPAAVAAEWSSFFAADGPKIKWRPHIVEVLEDGTLALSRGPYRITATDEAGTVNEYWGTYNSVWRLQEDGSWKVIFDAGSPAATAPSDEIKALLD